MNASIVGKIKTASGFALLIHDLTGPLKQHLFFSEIGELKCPSGASINEMNEM